MIPTRPSTAAIVFVLSLCVDAPVWAQSPTNSTAAPADPVPSIGELFTGTLRDFRRVPAVDNLGWLSIGGAAAAVARPTDHETSRAIADSVKLHSTLKAGAFVGGTPFQLGAAFATYGIGRVAGNGRMAHIGADLVRAQLIAESMTVGVKEMTRRARPAGSGFSFPSGHTTAAFASATVLQQHFGWKVGIAAYAVAAYVGTSRIHDRRHYLSDVAFGAALGTVAGRSVTVGHGRRALSIAPGLIP